MRWPFGSRRNETRSVALRAGLRGLAALTVRPTFEIPNGAIPTEMRLLRAGVNATQKGDFLFDEQAAASVMDFWRENGVDLTFDYEHQALQDPPIEAPVSCWRWVPEVRNGELWATAMCWTDRASAYIGAKEYRYWSPALLFDEESMRVKAIVNCALTNLPATKNIAPLLAASVNAQETKTMEETIKELRAQLAAKTSECEGLTAKLSVLGAYKDEETETCSTVGLSAGSGRSERGVALRSLATLRRTVREITGKDNDADAIGAIGAWKTDAASVATLKAEHAKREETEAAADLDAAFEQGVREGKLFKSPDHPQRVSLKAIALSLGGGKPTKDAVTMVRSHIATLSQVVTVTATAGNDGDGAGDPSALTEAEAAAILARGQSLEIAQKAKKHIHAQRAALSARR